MLCRKCGSKNNPKSKLCAKCLFPLHGKEPEEIYDNPGTAGLSFSTIMIIIMSVGMAVSVFGPLFSSSYSDVVTLSYKSRVGLIDASMQLLFTLYPWMNTLFFFITTLPFAASLITIGITVIGALTKRYAMQNISAVLNIVLMSFASILSLTVYKMTPNICFWTYMVFGTAVLYLTQRCSDSKNPAAIIGILVAAAGGIIGTIGYFSFDPASFLLESVSLESVSQDLIPAVPPIAVVGIIITIIGGVIMLFGFELELTEKRIVGTRPSKAVS